MRIRRSVAAIAATAALVAVPAVSASAVAPAAKAPLPGIVNCAGQLEVKPKEIVIACADAGIMITDISWSKWNQNTAKGTGTLAWNTCLPATCVDGIVQTYKVKITLPMDGLATGPGANGKFVDVFSKVSLAFPGSGPAGLETGSYTLDNPIKK